MYRWLRSRPRWWWDVALAVLLSIAAVVTAIEYGDGDAPERASLLPIFLPRDPQQPSTRRSST